MSSRASRAAERIRQEIPIIKVLADYGYEVDERGEDREQQFSCDLHGDGQDTKPSARVYPEGGQFFCFACGTSRDAVALVQEKEGQTFWPAVKVLEKRYGLPPLPWEAGDDERAPTAKEMVDEALDTSETPERALGRVGRFLDNITRERELPAPVCAGLWEAHDRVVSLQGNDVQPIVIVQATHKILVSAKRRLKEAAQESRS